MRIFLLLLLLPVFPVSALSLSEKELNDKFLEKMKCNEYCFNRLRDSLLNPVEISKEKAVYQIPHPVSSVEFSCAKKLGGDVFRTNEQEMLFNVKEEEEEKEWPRGFFQHPGYHAWGQFTPTIRPLEYHH